MVKKVRDTNTTLNLKLYMLENQFFWEEQIYFIYFFSKNGVSRGSKIVWVNKHKLKAFPIRGDWINSDE